MIDDRLMEQFDACRAHSDDLRQKELAALAEHLSDHPEDGRRLQRVQQFDVAVRRAMDDVPLPAGLAARVLAQLSAEAKTPEAGPLVDRAVAAVCPEPGTAVIPEPSATTVEPAPARRPRTISRRWLAVGAAAATGLALLAYYAPSQTYSREDVLEAAAEFLPTATVGGKLASEQKPPPEFPLSRDVLSGPQTRWVAIDGFLGQRGVLYRLEPPGGRPASLLVVRLKTAGRPLAINGPLPGAPGGRPYSTGGRTSNWKSGNCLYVLVVEGDEARFRSYLRAVQPVA